MANTVESQRREEAQKACQGRVFGVFSAREDAEACYEALRSKGFRASDIDVMMSETTRDRDYRVSMEKGAKAGSKAVEGVGVGGTIGAAAGATLAAVAAVGTTIAFPVLGGLIVAGPLAAALAGGGAGAVTGGLIGGLVGLGMTEQNAQRYNEALANGGVVLSVQTYDNKSAKAAQSLMVEYGGVEVAAC